MLTAAEAREQLGVSRETLRKLIKSGDLKATKTGGSRNSHYRLSEDDIADYIERASVKAAS